MKSIAQLFFLSLIAISCTELKPEKEKFTEIEKLQFENDSLKQTITEKKSAMEQQIITSLTFQKNNAE